MTRPTKNVFQGEQPSVECARQAAVVMFSGNPLQHLAGRMLWNEKHSAPEQPGDSRGGAGSGGPTVGK